MRIVAAVSFAWLLGGCFAKPDRPNPNLEVAFDNTGGGALVDFPALIRFDAGVLREAGFLDPATIRFFDRDSGTELAFDVDEWNLDGESLIWVKVPEIPSGATDKRISMFADGGASDPTTTWTEFAAVWHLAVDGDRYANAAGSSYVGTGMELDDATGVIGRGAHFRGGGSTIALDPGPVMFDAWDAFTLELYVDAVRNPGNEPVIIDLPAADQPVRGGRILPSHTLQIDISFESGTTFQGVSLASGFNYVVFTFDGQRLSVYGNGESQGSEMAGPRLIPATVLPELGGSNAFEGVLDEVRISPVARDPAWVAGQYRAVTGSFATVLPGS